MTQATTDLNTKANDTTNESFTDKIAAGFENAKEAAESFTEDLTTKFEEAKEFASQKYDEAKEYASQKYDEAKEKIDPSSK